MLRKIRIILATIFFLGITLLFIDITGVLHHYLDWMAKLQLLPAILSSSFIIVALILIITLLFGRIYCSIICPLGVMQDGFNHIGNSIKKNRFQYTKPLNITRYVLLGLIAIVAIIGIFGHNYVGFFDPYSNFGRIATQLFQPLYIWINNLLALLSEHFGSYAFYPVKVWISGGASLIIAAVVFILIGIFAIRKGRIICNTICPVGSLLSLISRHSLYRPVIDTNKCNGCTKCARNCKSACIDPEHHTIDSSRCVACMDCIENCPQGAITINPIGWKKKAGITNDTIPTTNGNTTHADPVDTSRRKFIVTTAAVATSSALLAQEKKFDGGLAVIEDKKIPERTQPLHPAGSSSWHQFTSHCTFCQLCVANCPNHVLHPNTHSKSLDILQPEMSFENGYCRPNCTRCGEVCPSGAIKPFTIEQKSSTSVGYAVVILDNCIAAKEGINCGTCARHCPSGAIHMVPSDPSNSLTSIKIPTIDENRCLGCGACEYYCPSRPITAIYIEGREANVQV